MDLKHCRRKAIETQYQRIKEDEGGDANGDLK